MAEGVLEARNRISSHLLQTPLILSDWYSKRVSERAGKPTRVYLKLESEQVTGSFKARGAYNKVIKCGSDGKSFTTASSGNHAAGVVSALTKFEAKGDIYLPVAAAPAKVHLLETMIGSNTNIKLFKHGSDCSQAETEARRRAEESDKIYLSPYNDSDVIAGQGTIGVEIVEQMKQLQTETAIDYVLASVGGGGLIGGISLYFNAVSPSTKIIGCQPALDNAMQQSVEAGKIVEIEGGDTLSDGTAGNVEFGSVTFPICQQHVSKFITVGEAEIAHEVLSMLDGHHKLIEGAAACALAALFNDSLIEEIAGKTVVVVICGANIGTDTLQKLLNSRQTTNK